MRTLSSVLAVLSLCVLAQAGLAQDAAQARKDLQAIKANYDAGTTLQADVALEIKFAEQPAEVQRGRIEQDGERYRVEFDQQVVISDGATVWMYLPDNREVQVYDAADGAAEGGFMRPQDFLTIYDNDGFDYAVVGEVQEGGKTYRQIEFKPLDRDSEYAKVRLTYDAAAATVRRVKVFNKDGSRFTLSLEGLRTGVALAPERFTFRAQDYPGVSVEDMRL